MTIDKSLSELLDDMFSAYELDSFIADYFPDVRQRIPTQSNKLQIVEVLLGHCSDHYLGDQLHQALLGERPKRHREFSSEWVIAQLQAVATNIEGPRVYDPDPGFVGREEMLRQLERALHPSAAPAPGPVCTLYGMSGIGKTQLARAVAQRMRTVFEDGQVYIPLSTLSDATSIEEAALKHALKEINPEGNYDSMACWPLAGEYLKRLAGRRYLIIADDVTGWNHIKLLRPPSGSALLIICRDLAALQGASRVNIAAPPLTNDEARQFLSEIREDMSDSDAFELARLCANVPLALRIVASALRESSRDIATYLCQLRKHGADTVSLTKKQLSADVVSIEAALLTSYELLLPESQRALTWLSILPSSFDWQAATVVLRLLENIDDILDDLLRCGLLSFNHETQKYTIHNLIRSFAAKRLKPEDRVTARANHARYYAHVSRDLLASNQSSASGTRARQRVREAWLHFVDAWDWAIEATGEPETDELLIAVMDCAMTFGGQDLLLNQQIRLLQKSAAPMARLGRNDLSLRLLLSLADAQVAAGETAAAIGHYQDALQLARKLGRLDAEAAAALGAAAIIARSFPPRPGQALMLYGWALAAAEAAGDIHSISRALRGLGNAELDRLALDDALEHYFKAYEVIGREDAVLSAVILRDCGNAHVFFAFGEELPVVADRQEVHIDQAEQFFRRSLVVAVEASALREALESVYSLAYLAQLRGHLAEADRLQSIGKSVERMLEAGDFEDAAEALMRYVRSEMAHGSATAS